MVGCFGVGDVNGLGIIVYFGVSVVLTREDCTGCTGTAVGKRGLIYGAFGGSIAVIFVCLSFGGEECYLLDVDI